MIARMVALLLGLGLFGLLVVGADWAQVWAAVSNLGGGGVSGVLGIYLAAFAFDTASWHLMLPSARCDPAWFARLNRVRLVGEALNAVVPAGSLGGEPAKAILLKRNYAIGYREAIASLIMTKTVNLLALIVFSLGGLVLLWQKPEVPAVLPTAMTAGLGLLGAGVIGFFVVQRWRAASRLAQWLARRRIGQALVAFLDHIHEVDERFVAFYGGRPGRFALAFALALAHWGLGTAEIYVALRFLGQPVGWAEAWMIETAAQLVRAGAFFIPGALGASEAGFVFLLDALSGRPALGLALALVRRGREALWIGAGLVFGWHYAWRVPRGDGAVPVPASAPAREHEPHPDPAGDPRGRLRW
ncbi:MAG: hypothetical protein D6826_08065 [Alphaproteobacteria bacterium]|nr:MAG: hypothetical protein D6826_08065 [Alphaproteobacteria bacterium]